MSRQPRRTRLALLLMGLAIMLIGTVWADARCQVVDAIVVEKRESVEALIDPYWRPTREVVVHYTPRVGEAVPIPWQPDRGRDGYTVSLPTSLESYDHLRPGTTVQVSYFPPLPDVARLADQSLPEIVFGPLWEGLRESGILL